jgi:hypothetical protein
MHSRVWVVDCGTGTDSDGAPWKQMCLQWNDLRRIKSISLLSAHVQGGAAPYKYRIEIRSQRPYKDLDITNFMVSTQTTNSLPAYNATDAIYLALVDGTHHFPTPLPVLGDREVRGPVLNFELRVTDFTGADLNYSALVLTFLVVEGSDYHGTPPFTGHMSVF